MSRKDFAITVATFGQYTHGKLKGKTNPKAVAHVTIFTGLVDGVRESVTERLGRFKASFEGLAPAMKIIHICPSEEFTDLKAV